MAQRLRLNLRGKNDMENSTIFIVGDCLVARKHLEVQLAGYHLAFMERLDKTLISGGWRYQCPRLVVLGEPGTKAGTPWQPPGKSVSSISRFPLSLSSAKVPKSKQSPHFVQGLMIISNRR